MKTNRPPLEYKGRNLGIVILVAFQILIGVMHVAFGIWLLFAKGMPSLGGLVGLSFVSDVYSIYTIVFGLLTLLFSVLLWRQKRGGWVGTITILVFVIIADTLTLLDLPSIPGIPKIAGFGEISYSILIIIYLLQTHIRNKYGIKL
jgi:hypothetical protein